MTLSTYLVYGLAVMLVKFAFVLVAAHQSAEAKERMKKTWTVWAFLLGIVCWPLEAAHMLFVLLRACIKTAIEAA